MGFKRFETFAPLQVPRTRQIKVRAYVVIMRHIGFDGVGVPGLDQYPSGLQGVVFFCPSWRPVVFPCTLEYQTSTVLTHPALCCP